MVRVVDGVYVTGLHAAQAPADHFLDGGAHRAEVHRNVRGVGDQVAVRIEQRAGEVQPLPDVHRLGGGFQPEAHLLGDRHEQVVEDLQQHRVGLETGLETGPSGRIGPRRGDHSLREQVPGLRHRRLPAVVDDGGGVGLGDDRRTGQHVARPHRLPTPQRCVAPQSVRIDPHGFRRAGGVVGLIAQLGQVGLVGEPGRLDRDRFGDQRTIQQERVQRAVAAFKRRGHGLDLGQLHGDRGIGSLIAQVHPANHPDALTRDALVQQLGAGGSFEGFRNAGQTLWRGGSERDLHRLFAHCGGVGQADPQRGKHAGHWWDQHRADAEGVGHRTCVLTAGAAERRQRVPRHVVSLLHGDLFDRVGHVRHRDPQISLGDLLG